jgi:hypothetical protein
VGVVLVHEPNAQKPVQRAGVLVAVEAACLRETERELAVTPRRVRVHEAVPGTVHGLDPVLARLGLDEEHVVAELFPVARGPPQLVVVNERRPDLDVAAGPVLAPAQILEHVPDHRPARVPERHPGRELGEVEEVELAAEPAVITLLGFLEPAQVLLEVIRIEEGRPVDARELGFRLVAAPVRPGQGEELDRFDRACVLEMGAAAEIGKSKS